MKSAREFARLEFIQVHTGNSGTDFDFNGASDGHTREAFTTAMSTREWVTTETINLCTSLNTSRDAAVLRQGTRQELLPCAKYLDSQIMNRY